ncbi:hypothetical protein HMPREF9374_1641 [Desmospora sp. 8437]|nr:hypothetical protein HMPREF9374_1641 [Desmospora sp. 8437]
MVKANFNPCFRTNVKKEANELFLPDQILKKIKQLHCTNKTKEKERRFHLKKQPNHRLPATYLHSFFNGFP